MNTAQYNAANPAISAWVSANAGTGKTKVLVDRVLRLLLAGAEPPRILCLTYTNAAAAEMQERISVQLGRWVMMEAAKLVETLTQLMGKKPTDKIIKRARSLFAEVLESAEGVRIQTIHAFCQSVLRRFPLEAGVSPHFTVIDERTTDELVHEARIKLLGGELHNAELKAAIAALTGSMSEGGINDILSTIVKERRHLQFLFQRDGGVARLSREIWQQHGVDYGVTLEALLVAHFNYEAAEHEMLMKTAKLLQQSKSEGVQQRGRNVERWLTVDADVRLLFYDDYLRAFVKQDGDPFKELLLKGMRETHSWAEEAMRREQRRLLAFSDKLRARNIAIISEQVVRVADALLGLYQTLKKDRALVDYDDLILKTLSMLRGKDAAAWVLFKLDGGLDHLLLDEAQDTSPEQWEITRILTEELFSGQGRTSKTRTLFVVGDEKQSIYSFQGAEPKKFDEMQRYFRKRIEAAELEFKSIPLYLSYRSTEPILSLVDRVFAPDDAKNGLVFSEKEVRHDVHRTGAPGRVELWDLVDVKTTKTESAWDDAGGSADETPHGVMARKIADEIAEWLNTKRLLPAKGRPVAAGDIIVLMRNRRYGFVNALARALHSRNVPVAGLDRLVLSGHIAIRDMIALGEFLLLPEDDLSLAAVMRSPLLGFTDEELFELAYDRGKVSLWQRLQSAANSNLRYAKAREFLADLLSHADRIAPYELYARALDTLGGMKRMQARLGAEVYELLNEFLLQAMRYESVHPPSLQGFIHWLSASEEQIKRDMEQGVDAVRIMTVHGAKGLQAPIIILPDTVKMPTVKIIISGMTTKHCSPGRRAKTMRTASPETCAAPRKTR